MTSATRLGLLVTLLCGSLADAGASDPRWVTGPPFFTGTAGAPVIWGTPALTYFTDPGDLSASVNHQAADAIVAAAAAVWNVPVASLTLARGGTLAEHVSGANVFLAPDGINYPADVTSANYAAVPIAVVYDTDGSVTDTLLGAGASAPGGCRQNAVTESVDRFDPAGFILHAVVILNGRCAATAAASQTQMQYQVMRAFGRVLGLAWSQTNDNVFTGVPIATPNQALHWPVMHPMDILCGLYTYQCMPQPFQLRPDDLASMVLLYGIGPGQTPAPGKQVSLLSASAQDGNLTFPDGQGMQGVNVLLTRMPGSANQPEGWVEASAVTGTIFRRMGVTPLAPAGTTPLASQGTYDSGRQGYFHIAYVPMPAGVWYDNHVLTTEAVNPLYIGGYSLGPYALGTVAPSGSAVSRIARYEPPGNFDGLTATVTDAAPQCGNGADGTATLPAPVDPSGWWKGLLCGVGHAAWIEVGVRANRTLTLDVTALDEQGNATMTKAMPVLGAWSATDPTGTTPTAGVTPVAFNSSSTGTTRLTLKTLPGQTTLRLMVADERGDGRPDFAFQGRILYADSIFPTVVPQAGATVSVSGMGFRPGNAVKVNGVAARVLSWSTNTLSVTLPAMSAAGAAADTPVDVTVTDLSTGATSTLTGALTYTAASLPMAMRRVSAPAGNVFAGEAAAVPFVVQVLAGDDVTPVAGQTVTFSATAGAVLFSPCGATTCSVVTGLDGTASTRLTPQAAGPVTVQATDGTMAQTMVQTDSLLALPAVGSVLLQAAPSGGLDLGIVATPWMVVQVLQPDGSPAAGVPLTFSASPAGSVQFGICRASSCTIVTDGGGRAQTGIMPLTPGPVTLIAEVDGKQAQAGFTAIATPDVLKVISAPSGSTYVGERATPGFLVQALASDGVTPLYGRPVVFTAPAGVIFEQCGTSVCTLMTNWSGVAATAIPLVPGTFTLQASEGGNTQTATFTALAKTNRLQVISSPPDGSAVGLPASTALTVQLLDWTGSPVSSSWVALTPVQPHSATFVGCGGRTLTCMAQTDSRGIVSAGVIPMIAGPISLEALDNPLTLTVTFNAVAVGTSLTPAQTQQFIAEGATAPWTLTATAVFNGTAAAGEAVIWTGSPGLQIAAAQTSGDGAGVVSAGAVLGPLSGGETVSATGCAWSSVCATFQGTGVRLADLRLTVVSGAGQTVSGSASAAPIVVQVTDPAGHAVAGATVSAMQTVTVEVVCPARGRCPAVPVLGSSSSVAVSDGSGLVSLAPMAGPGQAVVVHLAASVGTQGFATADVTRTP